MNADVSTYHAMYYPPGARGYQATIFLSSITLSIRYYNELGVQTDVYWLAEKIVSMEDDAQGATLIYKNNDGKGEKLVVKDPELIAAIKKHFSHHKFTGSWKYYAFGNTRTKMLWFFATILALLAIGYFIVVPWLGDKFAKNISKEWEINMGESMSGNILSALKVDSNKTRLINAFYRELRYNTSYPVEISVVESKEVNAFAIPGGNIVVYSSIINRIQTPEQLAGLLAHEASHIELRHSLRNLFRSLSRKMFLYLIIGNEAGIAGFLIDNADNLKGLEYSRSLETEADNNGITLMKKSGINPSGMLGLMDILAKETKGEPAEFLNTHPVFSERIKNIRSQIGAAESFPPSTEITQLFNQLKTGW